MPQVEEPTPQLDAGSTTASSGTPHMGPMDNVMQDLLVRWHRTQGDNGLWQASTGQGRLWPAVAAETAWVSSASGLWRPGNRFGCKGEGRSGGAEAVTP